MNTLTPDRHFSPEMLTRALARELYQAVASLPLICPHGHVDPRLFADPDATFGTPADLFIIPDHYVTRMLYSQGISLEALGVQPSSPSPLPAKERGAGGGARIETDHRKIWRIFCENFYLFRGTPSGIWLTHELSEVFGVDENPDASNADRLFDSLSDKLSSPEFSPRKLFERFKIEVLCTTDAATDTLEHHQAIRNSGWGGRILPTFRPDAVVNLDAPNWKANIAKLNEVSGINVVDYKSFIQALEQRRAFFRAMGATATDHAALTPATAELPPIEANAIFQRALKGELDSSDAMRFTAHMLMEMARMSIEDGLVMQLHPGSLRNHNEIVFQKFGLDKGADIPVQTEYTRNLYPLLNKYGNDPRLTLILFTLDETTYSRELAPLAGHYPALKLGPPWWFHDSLNGMARYFDQVMETAGLYNTAGFNDDTRAFCSIPARHDVWRRASANWLAGLVLRHIVDLDDAREMIQDLAVNLAKRAYKL
ncbi:MAG: glucuronate isomerase [Anaerolineales bacterium]|nr:glucuronate isomerase [Anaerolineales bacterium]